MKFRRIGKRGYLFSFNDPYLTNIYVIVSDERVFVLDTFLGSEAIVQIKEKLSQEGFVDRSIIGFNSHADYDHFWGNHALQSDLIIGHEKSRERILNESAQTLIKYKNHKRGEVIIHPPNFTFSDKLSFPRNAVYFSYTPGHTLDSASCYDAKDRVLFVGDNVESPIPYLNHGNFEQYIHTLESYLNYDWKIMIAGHDHVLTDSKLVKSNLNYLRSFLNWKFDLESMEESQRHRHIQHNLVTLKEELMKSDQRDNYVKHLTEVGEYH